MRRSPLLVILGATTLVLSSWALSQAAWAATNWVVHLAAGSKGEAKAQALPTAPTGATATCAAPTTAKTIKVTWTAVTHATNYTIYQSTTSATTGFASVATGVTTTSWTSGTLTAGSKYWFEVATKIGTNWLGPASTATGSSTINAANPFCSQP